jgi:hypothetical protein
MDRNHSTKGYKVADDSAPVTAAFYGMTVIEDAEIDNISAPTAPALNESSAYSADTAGIAGQVLPAGVYYPIRGSAIELTSGKAILWLE